MGAGKGKSKRTQQTLSAQIAPCAQRGYRFFVWEDGTVSTEEQVEATHPYAKMFSHWEQQIAEKITKHGIKPLEDIDICLAQGAWEKNEDGESFGGCVINDDGRIQLMVQVTPELLKNRPDYLAQVVCHEYGHGLFQRAFFTAYSDDGVPDYTEESVGILEEIKHGDKVASEALADAFALGIHNKIEIQRGENGMLPYDELRATNEYEDAYSLKALICSFLTDETSKKEFVYNALRNRQLEPTWSLFACLERGVEDDETVNPEGKSFREIYEEFRLARHAEFWAKAQKLAPSS